MKKLFAFSFLLALFGILGACGAESVPLEELPGDYSLEQAKADGVVVHENGDCTSGQKNWDAFAEAASAGKTASVRLGYYYTLDDPSRYAPEYYESVKDDYPVLYIQDLSFDGTAYTLASIEDGAVQTKTYAYMVRYDEDAPERAVYDHVIAYVLLNDKTVAGDESMTYDRLFSRLLSSRLEDMIDFRAVCVNRFYDESQSGPS